MSELEVALKDAEYITSIDLSKQTFPYSVSTTIRMAHQLKALSEELKEENKRRVFAYNLATEHLTKCQKEIDELRAENEKLKDDFRVSSRRYYHRQWRDDMDELRAQLTDLGNEYAIVCHYKIENEKLAAVVEEAKHWAAGRPHKISEVLNRLDAK